LLMNIRTTAGGWRMAATGRRLAVKRPRWRQETVRREWVNPRVTRRADRPPGVGEPTRDQTCSAMQRCSGRCLHGAPLGLSVVVCTAGSSCGMSPFCDPMLASHVTLCIGGGAPCSANRVGPARHPCHPKLEGAALWLQVRAPFGVTPGGAALTSLMAPKFQPLGCVCVCVCVCF
jgi:hypothetical protein